MNYVSILNQLLENKIIAILRLDSPQKAQKGIEALKKGGIQAIEVTLNTPGAKAFFGILSWIKGTVCAKHRNGERNSLSQSLTALPAPSGREPLAVHAKFPVLPRALPLGELARQRLRGRARYKQFHLRKKRLPEQTFLCGASFFTASRTACR